MSASRLRIAALLCAVALVLVGCTASPDASAPQPDSASSSAPSPSPAPSATPEGTGSADSAGASRGAGESATVVTIGDSIMAGFGLDPSAAWPELLGRQRDVSVVNLGCSGGGFLAIGECGTDFAGLVDQAAALHPAVILIQSSDNDDGQDADALRAATTQTLDALHAAAPGAVIVGLNTLWDQPSEQPRTIEDSTTALRDAVSAVGGTFLDVGQPLSGAADLLQDDSEHPTAEGQRVLVQVIADGLDRAGIVL